MENLCYFLKANKKFFNLNIFLGEHRQCVAQSSTHSLSYDRSIVFFKAISPQSAVWCFLFRVPVLSSFFKLPCTCLHLLSRVHVPSICTSKICFRMHLVPKLCPIYTRKSPWYFCDFIVAGYTNCRRKDTGVGYCDSEWLLWPQYFVSAFF
jgi:hypothetical protein